ncbi:MAG: hypothetical protein LAO21_21320 [Acidobacteriia bacterium]|nr:hypothetical protein [Terriglobia bacterium]
MSHMVMPSGATVDYAYFLDALSSLPGPVVGIQTAQEAIIRKTLTHDGTSDVWTYDISDGSSSITNPDGSTVDETSLTHDMALPLSLGESGSFEGLTYRSSQSDKRIVERHWTHLNFRNTTTTAT